MLEGIGGVGFVDRPLFGLGRLALLAAMIAAAGLSGCGRKGGLDLPPTASITDPQNPPAAPGGQGASPNHPAGQPVAQTAPPPPPPAKRWFPLDFLLN
jgi:predicted small lipoprotein YifL